MDGVEVRGGDIEGALRIFRRKVAFDGTLKIYTKVMSRRYDPSPSAKRRRKHLEALRRKAKSERRSEWPTKTNSR